MFSNLKKFFPQNFERLTVVFLLVLAAFLRLYRISDYMTFLGDEGRDVLVAKHILEGNLTLLGPRASAADFYLGPIYYYFMAPFLYVFRYNPVGPAIMVALFGIATVYLVYKIGKEFFNTKVGLFAASLYAVSPIVIAYSRSSWNPNPMPFFTLLTLYFLYKGVIGNKSRFFILSGLFLGIAMQLHYLSTFLGAIIFLYILIAALRFKKELKKLLFFLFKQYVLIFTGFVIGWSPFLFFEARHNFPNLRTIIDFIFSSGDVTSKGNFQSIVGDVFFRLFGRLLFNFPPSEPWLKPVIPLLYWLIILLGFSCSVILLYKLFNSKKEEYLKLLLITLWFFVGILLFGFYKKGIYDYYFAFLFPVPFLLVGNLLSFIYEKGKSFVLISLLIFAALFFINIQANPFKYVPNRQYEQVKKISEVVLNKADKKPFNFALITGGNSDHAYRYFFELEGNSPVTILNPQVDPQRKSVTNQLLIVCETNPCQPLGHSLWEIAGFGRAQIQNEWQVSVVKVFKLTHYQGK